MSARELIEEMLGRAVQLVREKRAPTLELNASNCNSTYWPLGTEAAQAIETLLVDARVGAVVRQECAGASADQVREQTAALARGEFRLGAIALLNAIADALGKGEAKPCS